jgi:patatin-like phospholipase/acyl hydrolase
MSRGGGIRVLCFDDGGVRVVTALRILESIQKRLYPPGEDVPQLWLYDHFDLVCGTGWGGLVAIFLGRLGMVWGDDRSIIETLS